MATSTPTVPRVFLDSSVFFAAAYSVTGSAHDLLLAAIQGRFSLVRSPYVLAETERNILKRAPRAHPAFLRFLAALPYQLSQPPELLISDTARVVVAKDAPVIAAARAARAMLVATYDRKHLLAQSALIEATFGIIVATPESVLAIIE